MDSATGRTVAFAFDIDGVLVKGKKPIPGARETIQFLQGLGIPFIFLTNGGGHTEEAHVAKLGQRLDLSLHPRQFVQSHTPFLDLVPEFGEQTVLVLGGHGEQIRDLARAYGFAKVVTSSDVMAEYRHVHPFPEMTASHHAKHGRRGAVPELHSTRIAAILVWTSPRDWCLDLQVVIDLMLSDGGVIGTLSPSNGDESMPNCGYQRGGQPKLFFCNPDLEWSTEHARPRFAQGAFREALKGIWSSKTRGRAHLEFESVGKPTEATYRYGERVLREYAAGEYVMTPNTSAADATSTRTAAVDAVYMIGDNPESDIAGANSFRSQHGIEWKGILVETGVYVPGTVPVHQPLYTARDVTDAVMWALRREGIVVAQDSGYCTPPENGKT
ncbi:HAD-superfamily hydrolase [Hypoxylon sp. FL1150]|nr:HAD-superfamily hydrolase [Hypoxylon sp. FL1150]